MNARGRARRDPALHVELELDAALGDLAAEDRTATLDRSVGWSVRTLLAELGLAASPEVAVAVTADAGRALRVRVDGAPVPFSVDLMRRTWDSLAPPDLRPLVNEQPPGETAPDAWLREVARNPPAAEEELVFRYVTRLVTEAIAERAECLVSPAVADAYGRGATGLSFDRLTSSLRALVGLGVSVADRDGVLSVLATAERRGASVEEGIERVYEERRGRALVVRVSPAQLALLEAEAELAGTLTHVRDDLQLELGIFVPPLVLQADEGLPDELVSVRVNDRTRPPRPTLPPAEYALTSRAGALVPTLAAEIRAAAPALLGSSDVELMLARIESAYPVLVRITLGRFSPEQLAASLRRLVAEQVPLRNPRALLEQLVAFSPAGEGDARSLAEYARSRQRLLLAESYGLVDEVSAIRFDPALEERAVRAGADSSWHEPVREQLWEIVRESPWTRFVVLTSPHARIPLRDVIAAEQPELRVLAETELPPGIAVDERATLSLPG